jgi:hypothetical protein
MAPISSEKRGNQRCRSPASPADFCVFPGHQIALFALGKSLAVCFSGMTSHRYVQCFKRSAVARPTAASLRRQNPHILNLRKKRLKNFLYTVGTAENNPIIGV